jgi:CRP/FNR family transcriptional regulator, cyclic AMP receptor protein
LLRKNAKEQLMQSVPLFARCTKHEIAALAAEADELRLAAGTELTREGATAREFIILAEGGAEVTQQGHTVNSLRAGDFLGEIALLSGGPRTATVTTTEPSIVLVLTDRAFARVTNAIPEVRGRLLEALSERLQSDSL